MFYNDTLAVTFENLEKLSVKTAEYNEDGVDMYAWIVDGGGANGMAWVGTACETGLGDTSKTSITRGPSRYNAIIETAEVNLYSMHTDLKYSFSLLCIKLKLTCDSLLNPLIT